MRNSIKNIIVLLNIFMIILAPMSPVLAANDNSNGGNGGNDGGGNSGGNSGGNGGANSGGNSGGNSGANSGANSNSGGNNGGNSVGNNADGNSGKDSPSNGNNDNGGADKGNAGNGEKKEIKNGGNSGSIDNSAKQKQAKADRKSVRESKLKKISSKKDKPEKNDTNNKSRDNLKNLLLDIPLTDESPYLLKQQSYETVSLLQGYGEESRRLEKISEFMSQSLNRSLWLDNRHILSSEIFKYDMHAAQDIKVLIDREKNSTLPQDELIYSFIKLIQSDKMLAYIGIQDMERIVGRMPAEKSAEFEKHLDKAIDHFAKAEDLIGKGSYIPAVQHYNNAWNESFGFLILNGAVLPPQIFIEQPADGSYTNSSDQRVAGAVFDLMVFFMTGVNITMDGTTSPVPLVNGSFEHNVTLKENLNTIEVSAINYFGNVGTANVTLDTILPVITITGIGEGEYYALNVSASVEFADLHLGTTEVLLDGKTYTSGDNISLEGRHDLTATAIDLAGNSAYKIINFTIDKTQPEVRLIYPANETFVRQTVSIDGSASDLNLDSVTLSVDGVKVSASSDFAWDTTAYSDGAHTITLDAVDKAGNSASTSVDVFVDNTLPAVTIKSPLNFYLRQGITIDADVTDANLESISVKMDGSEISTSLPYEMDTSLYPDGNHTIEIYSTDKAGNLGGKGVKVNFDNSAPEINITSPLNASFVKHAVEINGAIDDENLLAYIITVDGTAVSDSLPYLWDSFAYSDGNHTIRIDAADKAGNTASKEITVKVDNTLPSVQINFPPDGAFIKGVVDISVDVFDAYLDRFQIFINGVLVAENQTNFRWNTSEYPDGAYMIEVVAYDEAGNEMRKSVNVTVDNTVPVLYVSELNTIPTLDSEYSLLITTEAGVTATVNDIPVTMDNGSGIYNTNVSLGINEFIIIAIDHAGNSASWNKTILVDEDSLPDWYEVNVTGTDPLNGDSDSSKTQVNEAGNGIQDDTEDFDNDGLTNLQEFRLGTDPFASDSDGDGLTDSFEVFRTGTYPTSADTDGNNLTDANEDFDTDGLTNLQEQSLGTDPLKADSDEDTFSDSYEVNTLGTNPLSKDTDNDGLEDDSEVKLGTNPLIADTDGDGMQDGNESYIQTFTNMTAGIEATIDAVGDAGKDIVLENDNSSVLMGSLPGMVNIVEVSTGAHVNSALIKVYYNESDLGGVPESELKLFYYNETSNGIELVEDQGLNATGNYVWGNTSHLSIFGAAFARYWFDQWYVNWKKPEDVFKVGDRMRINANVHNTGNAEATNVQVKFTEGTQGGTIIGTTTIPGIAAGSSAMTSIEWTVSSGINQICVNVDPTYVIAEFSDTNNNACGDFSQMLDSDGDGLTDYDETRGMRVAFPYPAVKSLAGNAHSDSDGLKDGQEMGRIIPDPGNKQLYDYFADQYGWDKSLYDGYHYEYIADPTKTDTDGDLLNDKQELDAGTNPFSFDFSFLMEASYGYILGDVGLGDPKHDNMAYLGGSIASGFTPLVEWVALVRDVVANAWRGDWFNTGITAGTGLISAFPASIVADEVPEIAARMVKFVRAFPHKITEVAEYIVKVIPDHSITLLDNIYEGAATLLKNKGLNEAGIKALAESRVPLKELEENIDSVFSFIKSVEGPVVEIIKQGIRVNIRYIDDGARFISEIGATGLSKGEIGERAAYWAIEKKGLKSSILGKEQGFYKDLVNQEGIDLIYKDGDTFVIVESKFTSSSGNVGKGILDFNPDKNFRQMDDAWIDDAIDRMRSKNLISPQLADDLLNAKATGKISKELVVVQNVPIDGKTVVNSLTEPGLNIRNVELIKIGEAVP